MGCRRSRDRKLAQGLYLIVKRTKTEPGESEWGFPAAEREPGETMRDAKVRGCVSFVGEVCHLYHVGFSPMAWIDRGDGAPRAAPLYCMDTPRPSPRTARTRRVPRPVLLGHVVSVLKPWASSVCALWPWPLRPLPP